MTILSSKAKYASADAPVPNPPSGAGRASAVFNGSDTYLAWTPASPGNLVSWAMSFWTKGFRETTGSTRTFIAAGGGDALSAVLDNKIQWFSSAVNQSTLGFFRDTSAWYHMCFIWENPPVVLNNEATIFINGIFVRDQLIADVLEKSRFFNNELHRIGEHTFFSGRVVNGYLSEFIGKEGSTSPNDFGEFDANGIWVPKSIADLDQLSWGGNDFWLDFADAANLGNDLSGNGNHWTSVNMTTANASLDNPTENYAVLETQDPSQTGNIDYTLLGLPDAAVRQTTIFSSGGKQAWEYTVKSGGGQKPVGIIDRAGNIVTSAMATGATLTMRIDSDVGTVDFDDSGAFESLTTGLTTDQVPYFGVGNTLNCGQSGAYVTTAGASYPDSFRAVDGGPLAIPNPGSSFKSIQVIGNGGTQVVTGLGFSPTFLWVRDAVNVARDWWIASRALGVQFGINAFGTGALAVAQPDGVQSFDVDGFTVGSDAAYNASGVRYTYNVWKGASTSAPNSDGTISTTVWLDAAAGFSAMTFVGSGIGGSTIGHGLGTQPVFALVCGVEGSSTRVYAQDGATLANESLQLESNNSGSAGSIAWNSVDMNSSVITLGTSNVNALGENHVAFVWAEFPGYSAAVPYTGNGDIDGPLVNLGFYPAFFILRNYGTTGHWQVYPKVDENTANPIDTNYPFSVQLIESKDVDRYANGIKLRSTGANLNAAGNSYLCVAWAQHPFSGSNVAPGPAQ